MQLIEMNKTFESIGNAIRRVIDFFYPLFQNGTQHHGIGIIPNVYVAKTIKGVIEGRDEFLDKAIEIAKQK
jgi:hypothetical protein